MAINIASFWGGGGGGRNCSQGRARASTHPLARSRTTPQIYIYTKIYSYFFRRPPPLPLAPFLPLPSPPHSFSCFAEPSYICRQVNKVRCPCDPRNQWRGCLGFPDKEIIKSGGGGREGRRRGGRRGERSMPSTLFSLFHGKLTFNLGTQIGLPNQVNRGLDGNVHYAMDSEEGFFKK